MVGRDQHGLVSSEDGSPAGSFRTFGDATALRVGHQVLRDRDCGLQPVRHPSERQQQSPPGHVLGTMLAATEIHWFLLRVRTAGLDERVGVDLLEVPYKSTLTVQTSSRVQPSGFREQVVSLPTIHGGDDHVRPGDMDTRNEPEQTTAKLMR